MTSAHFQDRLTVRARHAGVMLTVPVREKLEAYFRLLARWNAKMNLTSLSLERPSDETVDRLLIEPLIAARYVSGATRGWMDFGSGGGSPAIPVRIACPWAQLTMIEAKARKAAFLREVVRSLELTGVVVENDRFENVAVRSPAASVDLITVRAVKTTDELFSILERLLSPSGSAILFGSRAPTLAVPPGLRTVGTVHVATLNAPLLTIVGLNVPRGT